MAWGMRGSKDSDKTDKCDESAHWFWRKLQKIAECNDMKDNRKQVLLQKGWKWWKQQFGWEFG